MPIELPWAGDAFETQLPPAVVLITTIVVAVPLADSVTEVVLLAHVGGFETVPPPVSAIVQLTATPPTNPLVEVSVMVSVLPDVAPGARVMVVGEAARVNDGDGTVTRMGNELAATSGPLVPNTVTTREPLVPAVVLMVSTLFPRLPEVSATEVGAREQVPAKVPVALAAEQVRAAVPAKLFTEASVRLSVVVAPDVNVIAVVAGVMLKVGAVAVTTIVDAFTTVVPLVPVTITLRTPLAPAVVLMVRTLVAALPEVSVAEVGANEQVPAAVPLAFVTSQVRFTVPAKAFCEANAMVSVLPVVAPAASVMALVAGVTVNVVTGPAAAVRKLDTSSEPRPVARSYPAVTR